MNLLGVKFDNFSMSDVLQKIEEFLNAKDQHYIVTPNPEMIVLAQKDKEFKEILNRADLSLPDGMGVVWASRPFGEQLKNRVTGSDLMGEILKLQNVKIFLLGGKNGAARKISEKFSNVVGFTENINESIRLINELQPNILFVALGASKQEKWIHYNMAKIPSIKVAVGVGGAFDFISGKIRRAPKFLRNIGLEWLWRLALQPWRAKRIYNAVIKFPVLMLISKYKNNL